MQEWSKRFSYLVSLLNRKLGYITELCPTTWKGAGDVKVHVRDRLIGWNPVVLPNSDTSRAECTRNRLSNSNNRGHDCRWFTWLKIEQSRTMCDRNDKKVSDAALLTRYQNRCEV